MEGSRSPSPERRNDEDVGREDEQDRRGPFQLNDVPERLESDDAVGQEDVQLGLAMHPTVDRTSQHRWEDLQDVNVPLSTYERAQVNGEESTAMSLLHKRVNLRIDSKYKFAADTDEVYWDVSRHYLDFLMVVSRGVGLDACLPVGHAHHNFNALLNLFQWFKHFRGKFGKLGFNPTESMLWIGTVESQDLWIGMAPRLLLEDAADDVPGIGEAVGDTRMSSRRYRMVAMFIIYCLSLIPRLGVVLMNTYGLFPNDFSSWSLKDATSAFDLRTTISLNLANLRDLHRLMVDNCIEIF